MKPMPELFVVAQWYDSNSRNIVYAIRVKLSSKKWANLSDAPTFYKDRKECAKRVAELNAELRNKLNQTP